MQKREVKLKEDRNKVVMLGERKGSVCKVSVDGSPLEHFRCLRCLWSALDKSGTDGAEC